MARITKKRRIVKQNKSRKKRMVGGGKWDCSCIVDKEEKEEEQEEEAEAEEEGEGEADDDDTIDSSHTVTVGQPSRSMRRSDGSLVSSLPPAARSISRHNPSSAPGVVSVLDIIHKDILKFKRDNEIKIKTRSDHEDKDLRKRLKLYNGDTITEIDGTRLTNIHKSAKRIDNLNKFKSLTQGNPGEVIIFTVKNSALELSPRKVDIKLRSEADIAAEAAAKARAAEKKHNERIKLLENKGGFWGGGKKKTHRRKKPVNIRRRKPSRRTKKMKVMVGGVPETTPQPPRGDPPVDRRRTVPPRASGAGVSDWEPAERVPLPKAAAVYSTPVKYLSGTTKTLKCTCTKQNDSTPAEAGDDV
jgi:hypothetical protein